jgi:hypothetical protein
MAAIDPLTAGAVLLATAATDAVYVMFTSAVVARKRVPAATWSSVWYLLSSYAVISYTENWVYVAFAAIGSWLGAYATITFCIGRRVGHRWAPRPSRLVLVCVAIRRYAFAFPRRDAPEVYIIVVPRKKRGRRESRVP